MEFSSIDENKINPSSLAQSITKISEIMEDYEGKSAACKNLSKRGRGCTFCKENNSLTDKIHTASLPVDYHRDYLMIVNISGWKLEETKINEFQAFTSTRSSEAIYGKRQPWMSERGSTSSLILICKTP